MSLWISAMTLCLRKIQCNPIICKSGIRLILNQSCKNDFTIDGILRSLFIFPFSINRYLCSEERKCRIERLTLTRRCQDIRCTIKLLCRIHVNVVLSPPAYLLGTFKYFLVIVEWYNAVANLFADISSLDSQWDLVWHNSGQMCISFWHLPRVAGYGPRHALFFMLWYWVCCSSLLLPAVSLPTITMPQSLNK